MPIFVSYRLLKSLKTCASIAHHVVGNAVAEDEDLPVADDFARGLVRLLGFEESRFFGGVKSAAVGLYHLVVSTIDGEGVGVVAVRV